MNYRKLAALLPAILFCSAVILVAAEPDANILKNSGALERLTKKAGVFIAMLKTAGASGRATRVGVWRFVPEFDPSRSTKTSTARSACT